jgi:NADH:ubiquinone oxidoreductase subunit
MSVEEDNIIPKKRKVYYDEYTNSFYPETYMDSLHRQCIYRAKMADVQNRSVEAKYSYVHKKVETEKSIYLMKNDKEVTYHKENLKDHKAYIKVLANILNEKPKPDFDGKYGRYGPGCSKSELEPLIQHQRYEMTPEVIRRRQAEMLLSRRKKMELIDRKMSTSALLEKISKRKAVQNSTPSPPVRSASPEEVRNADSKTPKLILPPITVTKSREGRLSRQSLSRQSQPDREPTSLSASQSPCPAVFLTDKE